MISYQGSLEWLKRTFNICLILLCCCSSSQDFSCWPTYKRSKLWWMEYASWLCSSSHQDVPWDFVSIKLFPSTSYWAFWFFSILKDLSCHSLVSSNYKTLLTVFFLISCVLPRIFQCSVTVIPTCELWKHHLFPFNCIAILSDSIILAHSVPA